MKQRAIYNKAKNRLKKEKQERLAMEMEEIQSIVNMCIDWARTKGFTRVRTSDIKKILDRKKLRYFRRNKRYIMFYGKR